MFGRLTRFIGIVGSVLLALSVAGDVHGSGCVNNSSTCVDSNSCPSGSPPTNFCNQTCNDSTCGTVTVTVQKARCGAMGTDCDGQCSGANPYGEATFNNPCMGTRTFIVCQEWVECGSGSNLCTSCGSTNVAGGQNKTVSLECPNAESGKSYQYHIRLQDVTGLSYSACNQVGTCPGACGCNGNCTDQRAKAASCCLTMS